MKRNPSMVDPAKKWSGPLREYDLIKEAVIAILVVGLLALSLAAIFSSPDEKALTLKSWAIENPADFVQTATGELAGTTTSASYGPPYNTASDGPNIQFLYLQKWAGVRIPINSKNSFVIEPLAGLPDAVVAVDVATWKGSTLAQQTAWATAYSEALAKNPTAIAIDDASGKFGPVPALTTQLLAMAKSGALDGALTTSDTSLPTNFTKPILFLADSEGYFGAKGAAAHLGGDQWGVMNDTGSWPGQSWLWLFSFWYQVEPFKSSDNADIGIMLLMGLLTMGLLFLPLLPIIRRIPYWIPVHRLIWRNWYRRRE